MKTYYLLANQNDRENITVTILMTDSYAKKWFRIVAYQKKNDSKEGEQT